MAAWARTFAALFLAWPGMARAQAGADSATTRDTLVMRLVAFRATCPSPAPPSWSMVDSTLGSGLRCSLVQAAAEGLRDQLRARPDDRLPAIDPWRALCVRLVVLNNTGSTGLPGDWMVIFDLSPGVSALVIIDRQTGAVATGRIVDDARPGDLRCVGG